MSSSAPSGAGGDNLMSTTGSAAFGGSTRGYTPAPLRGEGVHPPFLSRTQGMSAAKDELTVVYPGVYLV